MREITDVQETINTAPIADMEPIDGCQTEQNQFKKSGFESYGIQTEVAEKFTTKIYLNMSSGFVIHLDTELIFYTERFASLCFTHFYLLI